MPQLDVRKTYKLYIGGKFVRTESGRAYPVAQGAINVPRGSRKDVRDAVRHAHAAFPAWSGLTAYNRGQILYRCAEMLDARSGEFSRIVGTGGRREVARSVECLVWYAGWCDKLTAVAGTVNPVAAPYFTFTIPEPTGVVAAVAPQTPRLLGLVQALAPALAGGNTVVALASEEDPRAALVFGEIAATGDVPAGVVNIISGLRHEVMPWLASHMEVNAIDVNGCTPDERTDVERAAAANVKRVVRGGERTLESILSLMEMKTIWHPVGR